MSKTDNTTKLQNKSMTTQKQITTRQHIVVSFYLTCDYSTVEDQIPPRDMELLNDSYICVCVTIHFEPDAMDYIVFEIFRGFIVLFKDKIDASLQSATNQ